MAITACHDQLTTCLAAAPADKTTCLDAERACVRAAFTAAFQEEECAAVAVKCAGATDEASTRATARCARGVEGPAGEDGGTSCESPL